jgi:hypothetical protein
VGVDTGVGTGVGAAVGVDVVHSSGHAAATIAPIAPFEQKNSEYIPAPQTTPSFGCVVLVVATVVSVVSVAQRQGHLSTIKPWTNALLHCAKVTPAHNGSVSGHLSAAVLSTPMVSVVTVAVVIVLVVAVVAETVVVVLMLPVYVVVVLVLVV